ncbi:MAG: hypothetical protein ACK6CE_18390, partial [Planctomycetota bacterium]
MTGFGRSKIDRTNRLTKYRLWLEFFRELCQSRVQEQSNLFDIIVKLYLREGLDDWGELAQRATGFCFEVAHLNCELDLQSRRRGIQQDIQWRHWGAPAPVQDRGDCGGDLNQFGKGLTGQLDKNFPVGEAGELAPSLVKLTPVTKQVLA